MFRVATTLTGSFTALLIAASPSTLLATAPAAAQTERSITVHFGDLNLSQPTDVATIYHRITGAADLVCGPRELTGPRIDSTGYYRCVTVAVDRAVTKLDRPGLNAYHRAHGAPSVGGRKIARR